jgi:DNA repair protein RadC
MAHRKTEQIRILYLNLRNVPIASRVQAKGTIDHVPVYALEVVRRALRLNTAAFIMMYNCLSGDPSPSETDFAMAQQIHKAAEAFSLIVHDHLILNKSTELSFCASLLL